MGRRLEETVLHSEPVALQIPTNREIKAEKKKKKKHKQSKIASDEVVEIGRKKKNEDYIIEEETEANRKRKLEETPTVTEAKKKKEPAIGERLRFWREKEERRKGQRGDLRLCYTYLIYCSRESRKGRQSCGGRNESVIRREP